MLGEAINEEKLSTGGRKPPKQQGTPRKVRPILRNAPYAYSTMM